MAQKPLSQNKKTTYDGVIRTPEQRAGDTAVNGYLWEINRRGYKVEVTFHNQEGQTYTVLGVNQHGITGYVIASTDPAMRSYPLKDAFELLLADVREYHERYQNPIPF